ncbi:beta-glycosidase, partial [gut metagenome]
RNAVSGEDAYFQFALKNWKESADRVQFRGSVAYDESKVKNGYEIVCEGSNDGESWTELGAFRGNGMPGKASKYKAHSDPNKNSWEPGTLPTRMLNETLKFEKSGEFAYYRMRLKMDGAAYWSFFEMNFYKGEKLVDLLPSKFFNSAWMSATTGQEWLYVDLGSQSQFDNVKLHWINKAVKGKLQVSTDAKQWIDLADLPGGEANIDDIKVNGKGRYVKVVMDQPANNERYILSELEVMGKGGLLAHP